MAQLTKEQESFLKLQKVSPSMMFDASGLSKIRREQLMTELGKYFYYGGSPCQKSGHTLRTKAGHCIQCDTAKIAYQLRSSAMGYVYLAYSPQTKFIKIGFSERDPDGRTLGINNEAYGNIRDWEIGKSIRLDKDAGKKEFEIHAKLAEFQRPISYEKTPGLFVECREIFSCDLAHAKAIFDLVIYGKS